MTNAVKVYRYIIYSLKKELTFVIGFTNIEEQEIGQEKYSRDSYWEVPKSDETYQLMYKKVKEPKKD